MEVGISRSPAAVPLAPEQTLRAFVGALGSGDLDTATACFARDACLITPDATAVRGRTSIRVILAQLVLARVEIAIEHSGVLIVGEIALARDRWTICSDAAEGTRYRQTLNPTLVLRWVEGAWKLAVAIPWG